MKTILFLVAAPFMKWKSNEGRCVKTHLFFHVPVDPVIDFEL